MVNNLFFIIGMMNMIVLGYVIVLIINSMVDNLIIILFFSVFVI